MYQFNPAPTHKLKRFLRWSQGSSEGSFDRNFIVRVAHNQLVGRFVPLENQRQCQDIESQSADAESAGRRTWDLPVRAL